MKNKIRFTSLLLTALMLFSLTACGDKPTEPEPADGDTTAAASDAAKPAELKTPKTIETPLWDLTYDEADGWVYDEDDFYDDDDFCKIVLTIPKDGAEYDLISAEIMVSIEDPYSFRDYLTSYGFDEYEYAVNNAYELTPVGGIDCLKEEGNYWGSPCLRYLNRVEGASATVLMEIVGEHEDARVEKLLSGLTINLEDIGNEDGPWSWEGEPFSAEPRSVMVGTHTLSSQWLPFTDCIITKETFQHAAVASGNQVFLLSDGAFQRYDYDGTSLKFAEDIALSEDYEDISIDTNGTIWLSNFMAPLISWKDGKQTASYEGPDHVAMHPSGTWGVSWFSDAECEKITLSGGGIQTQPLTFKEVDLVRRILVDENHIYVCGSDVNTGDQKVFIYDAQGTLQKTLTDADGGGLGSITFIAETANGYLALDGNMREVVLWAKDGTYIGAVDDSDLFGTSYPWFCGGAKLADGSILAIMTETRADKSAEELVAFKLSGF